MYFCLANKQILTSRFEKKTQRQFFFAKNGDRVLISINASKLSTTRDVLIAAQHTLSHPSSVIIITTF